MKTKREVLERFAEEGYCSSIDCRECAYLELCSSDESLTIKGRLQKIGALAILRMFPKKKKSLLENGTKIKFSDGRIATLVKIEPEVEHQAIYYQLDFGSYYKSLDYLVGKTWEVVE
jgi:hypothetical protein